ncbi:MAG: DNA starvation/stationary phase protection protein [Taibaiella sp.]|nr:DNA starvation/stationary phase protection protein [Taibaiella sp.]
MGNNNKIGLNSKKAQQLANKLNALLADYQIFYMNVRGLHWNIGGNMFFELHLKFEELYTNLLLKVDEVAERVLTLGNTPIHSFSDYIKTSELKEAKDIQNGEEGVTLIVATLQKLIVKQRELLKLANDAEDEGSSALMSDYIREQEKLIWMYSSFLKKI